MAALVLFDDPKLTRLEARIATHRANTITEILETGKLLAMAHEVLAEKGKNGKFAAWAEERCGIARSSAARYMKAFAIFGTQRKIRGNVSLGAVEYLSGDVPAEATEIAVERVQKGETIFLPQAREIVKCVSANGDETTTSVNAPGLGHSEDAEEEDAEEEEYEEEELEEDEDDILEEEEEETIEEKVSAHNKEIESFCRHLLKEAKLRPEVCWLDDKGRWDGFMRKFKQSLDTLRSGKCVVCPACKGEGCKECQKRGYLPKLNAEGISG